MAVFLLIHGAGDVGWSWHLVARELKQRGHEVIAPDLPGDDASLTVEDYAEAVVTAVGDRDGLIVLGHWMGAYTAPLVADRLAADVLVLLAGMIPARARPRSSGGRHRVRRRGRGAVRARRRSDGQR